MGSEELLVEEDSAGADAVSVPSSFDHFWPGVAFWRTTSTLVGVMVYVDSVGVIGANRGSREYSKVEPVIVGKEILI